MKRSYADGLSYHRFHRKEAKDDALRKINKCHNDIVDHDPHPAQKGTSGLVNAKWISFFNILYCFVDIFITQHLTDKVFIKPAGKKTDHKKNTEQDEHEKNNTVIFTNR